MGSASGWCFPLAEVLQRQAPHADQATNARVPRGLTGRAACTCLHLPQNQPGAYCPQRACRHRPGHTRPTDVRLLSELRAARRDVCGRHFLLQTDCAVPAAPGAPGNGAETARIEGTQKRRAPFGLSRQAQYSSNCTATYFSSGLARAK
jgi:hypothetical protein